MTKPAKPLFEQRRERRKLLCAAVVAAAGGSLAGCDAVSNDEGAVNVLRRDRKSVV